MSEMPTAEDLARDLRVDLHLIDSAQVRGLLSEWGVSALKAACRRALAAEAELTKLKASTYCAYCGHTVDLDAAGEEIARHIRTCDKHPMRAVTLQLASFRQVVGDCLDFLVGAKWAGVSAPSFQILETQQLQEVCRWLQDILDRDCVEVQP